MRKIFWRFQQKLMNSPMGAIALMTFCFSCSSLMVFTLLPTFLSEELHVNTKNIGYLEAFVMWFTFVAKSVTGIISDYYKTRKPLIILGSLGTIMIKPFFALAGSFSTIFFAKSIDRLSKGIRSSPTDALIADLSIEKKRGLFYGIRQSFYTLGAIVGGGVASILFTYTNNYRFIFWVSSIPAILALVILIRFVPQSQHLKTLRHSWQFRDITSLPRDFWWLLIVVFLLMLARFSETFVSLRVREVGFEVHQIPLLFVLYESVHTMVAIPFGYLADRYNRTRMLFFGIFLLFVTNFFFLFPMSTASTFIGFILWGLHMGLTQGLLSTLVSRYAPDHLRCSAFSLFYLVTGFALLLSNIIAGHLSYWLKSGNAPFLGGIIFTLSSIIVLSYSSPIHPSLTKNHS